MNEQDSENQFSPDRLSSLLNRLVDELITDEQFHELDQMLGAHADARAFYHLYMALHCDLEFDSSLSTELPSRSVHDKAQYSGRRTPHHMMPRLLGLAAAVLLLVTSVFWMQSRTAVPERTGETIATIAQATDVQWHRDGEAFQENDVLGAKRLRLVSGLVRLRYEHGAVVSLVGPADFEIFSDRKAFLHTGTLAAYVPDAAEGFCVDTPSANVTDLGTEFGVRIGSNNETQLSVFDGSVELRSSDSDTEVQLVSAGESYEVDSSGTFRRTFELAPYREARDSLRGWRIIWEPFGPGSETGLFPGGQGAGWSGPWKLADASQPPNPKAVVLDENPIHPGAEYYLTITDEPETDRNARAKITREFVSIDSFVMDQPYSIELLIRLQSDPEHVESLRVFSLPSDAAEASWAFEANRKASGDVLSWLLPIDNSKSKVRNRLPLKWWESVRCLIHVDPVAGTWRAMLATPEDSIEMPEQSSAPLGNRVQQPMILGFEAIGQQDCKSIQFSIDEIRIQNN